MSNSSNVWKPVAIAAICVIAVESVCYGMGVGWKDKDYIDKASDFEKETAGKIKTQNETGESLCWATE